MLTIKALDGLIEVEEDEETTEQFELLKKEAISARKILTVVNAKGMTSQATIDAYSEELAWLSRPPTCNNPMPLVFRQTLHGAVAAASKTLA